MNETEKRAFGVLGEEEKAKIAGGVKEDEALTNEQCGELKKAISQLSEEDQLKIAGGQDIKKITPEKNSHHLTDEEWEKIRFQIDPFPRVAYGMPHPEKHLLVEMEERRRNNHEE